ncbi:MAG: hypothetical protein WA609_11560 [Terriglobales bacterium]
MNAAKLAVSAVPPLEQIGGVEPLLLSSGLLDLIRTVLASPKTFKNFARAEGLLIGRRRLLAHTFEALNIFLQANPELLQLLTKQTRELEFGSRASARQRSAVGARRSGKKSVQSRNRFLGSGHLQGCVLQS